MEVAQNRRINPVTKASSRGDQNDPPASGMVSKSKCVWTTAAYSDYLKRLDLIFHDIINDEFPPILEASFFGRRFTKSRSLKQVDI